MEQPTSLSLALSEFERALNGLIQALETDLSLFSDHIPDLLKNGQIQKFEYCIELAWKLGKRILEEKFGVVQNSPIPVFRELHINNVINEQSFLDLREAVRDRNLLSHVYRESLFDYIHQRLPIHLASPRTFEQDVFSKFSE